MSDLNQHALVRIYLNANAMSGDRHLVEIVMGQARRAQLAGATVLRGLSGFGHAHRIHGSGSFDLGEDRPVVVEIVDTEDRCRSFVDQLSELRISLITLEKVTVLRRDNHQASAIAHA